MYVAINKDAEKDPSVKSSAAAWFKRMEDGDESALQNWRVWRELSIKKYEEEYSRLNITFDVYTGESQVGQRWMIEAVERLEKLGLIEDHDGAKLVDLEKWKLGKAVLRKKGFVFVVSLNLITHLLVQMELAFISHEISAGLLKDTRNSSLTR